MLTPQNRYLYRYSSFRAFSFSAIVTGFIVVWYALIIFIQKQPVELAEWWVWLIPILLPMLNPIAYYCEYVAVENSGLIVIGLITRKFISIPSIIELKFERRLGYHVLSILYLEGGITRSVDKNVEFFDTHTLLVLQEQLQSLNPAIRIVIDEDSKRYQEKKKDQHLKVPKSSIGWIQFGLKWFLVGSMISFLLLGLPNILHPDAFPHG
jgi:hypothetical protein